MDITKIFKTISALAKKEKTPVYVVGGFVRDYLMGLEQKKDIDFVVEGSGLEFTKKLDKKLNKGLARRSPEAKAGSLVEFPDFDTARYVFTNEKLKTEELVIEFAGARSEKYEAHSRKPKVEKAVLEQDLSRRDFTVNAIAVDVAKLSLRGARRGRTTPACQSLGQRPMAGRKQSLASSGIASLPAVARNGIIDPFNGQKDIKDKILRTPLDPDTTFSDDPLRMMRAIRFAGQLEFAIEKKTLEAIFRNRERIKIISAERVQEELFKMLSVKQPSVCFTLLFQTHLMDLVLPEVSALDGVEEVYGHQHKNNLAHTLKVVDNIAERSDKISLRLAGLLHDIGKAGTKKFIPRVGWTFYQHEHLGKKLVYNISKRLRFSTDLTKYLAQMVRYHQQPISLMDEGITDSAVRRLVVNLGENLEDLLILGVSDITTGNPNKLKQRQNNYLRLRARIDEVNEKDKLRAFQSPFRGDEIMTACHLKPGPTVGKIKEAIEEAILDGIIPNEYEPAKKYFEKIKDEYLKKAFDWERVK